jgi:hypothetical protein
MLENDSSPANDCSDCKQVKANLKGKYSLAHGLQLH